MPMEEIFERPWSSVDTVNSMATVRHVELRRLSVSSAPDSDTDSTLENLEDVEVTRQATLSTETLSVHNSLHDSAVEECPQEVAVQEEESSSPDTKPFHRWVSTLRRKKAHKPQRPATLTPRTQRWTLDDFDSKPISPPLPQRSRHQKSGSLTSSLAFVTAVKSATATIASASIATVSRNSRWRRGQQQSSLLSGSDARPSVETQRSIMDEAAKQRSRKRRDKLEELSLSEEGYLADLKALSNALFTLLGNRAAAQTGVRQRAAATLARLITLHDSILTQLRQVVPYTERDQAKTQAGRPSHSRWYSVDGTVPTRTTFSSIRQVRRSLTLSRCSDGDGDSHPHCEPRVVALVVKIFSDCIADFAEYEKFGSCYEMMRVEVDQTRQSIASWSEYDNAIETLACAINPVHSRDANRRKALSVKDLLIKPIQRLPRYELLFSDLRKLTPVYDDPDCHGALERLLEELHEACCKMNHAREDHVNARVQGTTWLVGDRLTFSSQVPRSVYLQLLGKVVLCGCLHVVWRTRDRIKGCYAICILFETTLLLATAPDDLQKYSTLAGVALANATMAECDNMKGLQCYTTPHSWKIVFEHTARMYEMIFTACSSQEKQVWSQHLTQGISTHAQAVTDGTTNIFELHSPLIAEMRSIGKAFGKAGSFVERMSVHRTATVGPTTDLNQVVIKNTQNIKEALDSNSTTSLAIPRSQSVATPSHVQTIAPRRADRVRLESLLSDVWTKDQLPYPGMTARRTDPIRASANHVMRKFSMASITSNFSTSKRNASSSSISRICEENIARPYSVPLERQKPAKSTIAGSSITSTSTIRPPLVDFHNAPEAFLPEDFGLQQDPAKRKRSAFRTLTMTMERPFSPLMQQSENKPAAGLRRAQSVRQPVPKREERHDSVVAEEEDGKDLDEVPVLDWVGAKSPRKSKSMNRLLRIFG